MNTRHEERYKRAVARITQERRATIEARVLKERGYVAMPTDVFEQMHVRKLIAMKLGERQ